ncbi:MAG TPA: Cys-tRNA(Pro) deacylase [Blastocatellia bacterium]|nr:Cys-tRNA(Pro) deacylase [Blastocatellia bacterium]
MDKTSYPVTPAVRLLREKKIAFEPRLYDYKEHGGTARSAAELQVPEHEVIKTIVMQTDDRRPLIVLMHGDREISTKELARAIGAKTVSPCAPEVAQKQTGYQVGGTSPFGTRRALPVYVEKSIFDLPRIYINGGKRGFLVAIDPNDIKAVLPVTEVQVAIAGQKD